MTDHMTTKPSVMTNDNDGKTILACIDGSIVTQSVCDYAAWYADKLGISVTLLHALKIPKSIRHDLSGTIGMDSRRILLDELAQLDERSSRVALKHGEALMRDAKAHIVSNNNYDIEIKKYQRHGTLLEAIEHIASSASVIILGRRGQDHQLKAQDSRAQSEVNLGSQIETVARAMHQPILICSDNFKLPDSYMLAYDGSATADKAVQMICDSDLSRHLKGYLVMAGHQDSKHQNSLYKAKDKLSKAGLEVEAVLLEGERYGKDVVNALIKYRSEQNISMMVVGAYGHSKLRQFFVGSTTTKLLATTTAPVLLLR